MKHFYIYIFLLCAFIFAMSYYNTLRNRREPFESNTTTIVLLGDSILKNNAYVENGNSVEDILIKKTEGRTRCLAKDQATIGSMKTQLDLVPPDLNNANTTVFLSVGGNDIIQTYVEELKTYESDKDALIKVFADYTDLVKRIRKQMNKAKLVLVDIYYPTSDKYKDYHPLIKDWNALLHQYAANKQNNIDGVLKISEVVTKSDDFTFDYEPSDKVGVKIADQIYKYVVVAE